jgi:hypothetical protein
LCGDTDIKNVHLEKQPPDSTGKKQAARFPLEP